MGSPACGPGRGAHGQGAGAPAAPGRRAARRHHRPWTFAGHPFWRVLFRLCSPTPRYGQQPSCPTAVQVEDLSRQVASSRQQPVTVVHTSGSGASAGTYVLYGAAGAVLGVVVYYRVFKGWTLGDMLYATRRGLKDGLAQVSAGARVPGLSCRHARLGGMADARRAVPHLPCPLAGHPWRGCRVRPGRPAARSACTLIAQGCAPACERRWPLTPRPTPPHSPTLLHHHHSTTPHPPHTYPAPLAGLEQLGSRVAEVRAKLQERIAALARRQEEMLGAQAETQAALAGVGRDVEHTRGQVGQVRSAAVAGPQRRGRRAARGDAVVVAARKGQVSGLALLGTRRSLLPPCGPSAVFAGGDQSSSFGRWPAQIHAVVMDLEASMAEVGVNQRHANHGIYVLCKAVRWAPRGSWRRRRPARRSVGCRPPAAGAPGTPAAPLAAPPCMSPTSPRTPPLQRTHGRLQHSLQDGAD